MNLLLLATLLAGATPTANNDASPVDCRAERIALYQSLQPTMVPHATLDTQADADPLTVEFFIIESLAADAGHVSDDGQVLYVPAAAVDEGSDPTVVANLYAQAIDKLLARKVGDVCPPLRVPPHGT